MRQYLDMQGVRSMGVTMTGDFNGKRGKIKKVICDNGEFSEKELLSEYMHLPIMAYTSGIKIDSEIGPMIWFCGLRDSAVAPRRWHDEHNIESYVYYTISLEEDTPPGDNDPIYVKVAKKDAGAFHRH